jgi:hypothetical protein
MKAPVMPNAFLPTLSFAPTMVAALRDAPIITMPIVHRVVEMGRLKMENSVMGIVPLNAIPRMRVFLKRFWVKRQIARRLVSKKR